MKQKPEQPAFRMPLPDLLVLAAEKIAFTRRTADAEALARRGWTDTRITKLEDAFKAVGKLPTDDELEQAVRKAEKNEERPPDRHHHPHPNGARQGQPGPPR